jgi:hypothetical protein
MIHQHAMLVSVFALASATIAQGGEPVGADLVCSSIDSVSSYATLDGYRAFSFGNTTCNYGDAPIVYNSGTSEHPVFSTTLYRIMDGRIEQIGVGFVNHTFFPLQGNACGFGCTPAVLGSLGAGCSDVMSGSVSGIQADLAPRSEINPYTADFPYPFTTIGQTGNSIYKRVKAPVEALEDADAVYVVETQYISVAETTDAARNNNASYKRFTINPSNGNIALAGPTVREQAAIYAWADHGLGANTADPSVMVSEIQIPGDGIVHVASKAIDLGDGTWRYEYAVHNQNSARSIGSVAVPTQEGAPISTGFNGVEYLDAPDSNISSLDWLVSSGSGVTSWQTEDYFANMDANAIRWGTMYNFSLVSDRGPGVGSVELGMFEPGDVESVFGDAVVPNEVVCAADFTGEGDLNFLDVSAFLSAMASMDPDADIAADGNFNFLDVSAFLQAFSNGCP